MKKQIFYFVAGSLCLTGCQKSSQEVVKTSYFHQYGPEVKGSEWKAQGSTGDVTELLASGIEVRKSYVDGVLQGTVTWSFPYSKIVERFEEYDGGVKISFGCNYPSGSPNWLEEHVSDKKFILKAWYEDGSPRLVEEYRDGYLVEGQYCTEDGDVESTVTDGNGMRIERGPRGQLLSRDRMVDKELVVQETFHPNGLLKDATTFRSSKKDGLRKCFDDAGRPELVQWWNHDQLNGMTIEFQEGVKVAQIPYVNGKKEGIETHFRPDTGAVSEEIAWVADKKHGIARIYTDSETVEEYYWKGMKISSEKYEECLQNESAS